MNKAPKRLAQLDYVNLILDGVAMHNEYLSEFFFGESKQAEETNIGYDEFYSRLLDANNSLIGLIDVQWMERKREIAKLREMRDEKGESFEDLEFPEKSHFLVQAYQVQKLTGNKYSFFLSLSNLEQIDRAIKDSMKVNVANLIQFFRYKEVSFAFKALHHTIITVCELVKPMFQKIEPLKYFPYFFDNIDFHKLGKTRDKKEQLDYCNAIYWGLEQNFKVDVDEIIRDFQNSISNKTSDELLETQKRLIEIIGNLKIQTRQNQQGISFTLRYNAMYKDILSRDCLFNMDYIVLIKEFEEVIANDLLSRFTIIAETIHSITSIGKTSDKQQKTGRVPKSKYTLAQIALIHIYKNVVITDPRSDNQKTADQIAEKYGFDSATSGWQLFDHFNKLDGKSTQRTGTANKKLMVQNIKKVLVELTEEEKTKAQRELEHLEELIKRG